MKRPCNRDMNTYEAGVPHKNKRNAGLVAGMVVRYDDRIKYHLGKSYKPGVSTGV